MNKLLKKYNDIPIAAKAALWFVFCNVLQKCVALITTPVFTRLMTPDQYGQFSIYNSWLQIFTIITTLRLNWGVFNKGMSKYKEDRDVYTVTMQTITTALTLITFVLYLIFRDFINSIVELPTFIMIAIFAELSVTPAIDFWTIRKRYEYIYVPVVIRSILMVVANAVLGVVAVLISDEKGYARILSCVFVNIIFGSVLYVYNIIKAKRIFYKPYAVFAIKFNIPLFLHYLSQYILDQFDRVMIQKMVGMASAGIYSVAYNAAAVLRIVTQSVNNAFIPWQYEKLEEKKFKEVDNMSCVICSIVSVCAMIFCCLAPEMMSVLAGKKYIEAVYCIPPIIIGLQFSFMYSLFANVEFFYEENKYTMYISMAGAAINVVLNYFGIKFFGFVAAAYTTAICFAAFTYFHYTYMSKCVKEKENIDVFFNGKRYFLIGFVTSVLCLSVTLLYGYPLIRYIIIAVAILIGLFFKNKISMIWRTIKRK